MNFDFGMILTRMWNIGWRHKVLWLFQFLPALTAILALPFLILFNPGLLEFLPKPFNRINEELMIVIFLAVTFIFSIVSVFISTLAQGGTTLGALKVERGAERLAFRELFTESLPYFWRIFGLYMIFFGGWMVLYLGVMSLVMLSSIFTFGLGFLCLMPFFLLMLPIMLIGLSVVELAQAAILAGNMRTLEAITHAWKIFRANPLSVLLLMVILYFGMTMLSSLVVFPIMFPLMILPMLFVEQVENFERLFPLLMAVWFLMFILIYTFQSILMAFFQSAWAVAYLRLTPSVAANVPVVAESTD
jgi:hypothetical protein